MSFSVFSPIKYFFWFTPCKKKKFEYPKQVIQKPIFFYFYFCLNVRFWMTYQRVFQNKNISQRINQNKIFYGGKPKMTYITAKTSLTLFVRMSIWRTHDTCHNNVTPSVSFVVVPEKHSQLTTMSFSTKTFILYLVSGFSVAILSALYLTQNTNDHKNSSPSLQLHGSYESKTDKTWPVCYSHVLR